MAKIVQKHLELTKKPAGIMFHHFHDDFHLPSQGSLSASDFDFMISWLRDRYDILDAKEYIDRFLSQTLKNTDICLSFDDLNSY